MHETVVSASSRNLEKMGRPKTRSRASNTQGQQRSRPTRREQRIKNLTEPGRVALRVGYKLLEQHGGIFRFDYPYQLVDAMDEAGVIDRHVVHDSAVRYGVIANAIENELIETGRLELTNERVGGKSVRVATLSADERSIHQKELLRRKRKKEANDQDRQARRDAARAAGEPVPMKRRKRSSASARRAA